MKKLLLVDDKGQKILTVKVGNVNNGKAFFRQEDIMDIDFKEINLTDPEIVTILLTELEAVSQKEIQAVRIVLNHLTK